MGFRASILQDPACGKFQRGGLLCLPSNFFLLHGIGACMVRPLLFSPRCSTTYQVLHVWRPGVPRSIGISLHRCLRTYFASPRSVGHGLSACWGLCFGMGPLKPPRRSLTLQVSRPRRARRLCKSPGRAVCHQWSPSSVRLFVFWDLPLPYPSEI